jgi:hypothetical protein
MMIRNRAIKIGRVEAFKSVTIGLLIAQLIMMLFSMGSGFFRAFLWFAEFSYQINLVIAIVAIYLCAYVFGGMAGISIIIKRWNYRWTGFLYGMLILVIATFLASWTGFFQEGLEDVGHHGSPFKDYIFTPLFSVTLFGFFPVLIVGFWFGSRIHKKGEILQSH